MFNITFSLLTRSSYIVLTCIFMPNQKFNSPHFVLSLSNITSIPKTWVILLLNRLFGVPQIHIFPRNQVEPV